MDLLRIAIAVLAVWRVTHLLQAEDGPFDVIAHWRNGLRRLSLAGLADCFYCLSIWLAAPAAYLLGSLWMDRLLLWPALSGAAIFLNHFAESSQQVPSYYEEPNREEKAQCFVAEMPEGSRWEALKPTPAPSEFTILSCAPRYSGTQAQQG